MNNCNHRKQLHISAAVHSEVQFEEAVHDLAVFVYDPFFVETFPTVPSWSTTKVSTELKYDFVTSKTNTNISQMAAFLSI